MKKEARHFARQGQEVAPEPYHYRACGLDDVYLLNGFEPRETAYGRGVAIDDVEGLHRAIGRYLMNVRRPLSGKEFRFLRKQMEMTQQELAQRLRIDVQAIARYEKEQTKGGIPGPTDMLTRTFYAIHITNASTEDAAALLEKVRAILEDGYGPDESTAAQPHKNFRHTPSEGWRAGAVPLQ